MTPIAKYRKEKRRIEKLEERNEMRLEKAQKKCKHLRFIEESNPVDVTYWKECLICGDEF